MKQFTELKFGGNSDSDDWEVKISVRNTGGKSTQELIRSAIVELLKGGDPVVPLEIAAEVIPTVVDGDLVITPGDAVVGYYRDGLVLMPRPVLARAHEFNPVIDLREARDR